MKKYILDNLEIKRYSKGMTIKVNEPMGFSSTIALTEEETNNLEQFFHNYRNLENRKKRLTSQKQPSPASE